MLIHISLLLFLALTDLYLIFLLRKGSGLARPLAASLNRMIPEPKSEINQEFIEEMSRQSWSRIDDTEEKCVSALRWLMDKIDNYRTHPDLKNHDASALLGIIERDRRILICYNMAKLYRDMLRAAGVHSRILSLQRNIFDRWDSHITVEAYINGKWALFDPTFNISFVDSSGALLSSQEVKARLLSSTRGVINTKFYGGTASDNRVERYYLNILLCFNNVFFYDKGKSGMMWRYLPLRYWFGPKLYYEKLPNESISHLEFLRRIYFMSIIILPLLMVLSICLIFFNLAMP